MRLRFAIYIFLLLTIVVLLLLLSKSKGVTVFAEDRLIENSQLGIILASGFTVFIGALYFSNIQKLSCLLVILFSLASIRELDLLMDKMIPVMGWKLPGICIAVYGLFFWLQNRIKLESQISEFLTFRSFSSLCLAFVIIALSQLLGWELFLKALLSIDYSHNLKRLIEESTEVVGYFLLFIGSIEFVLEINTKNLFQTNQIKKSSCEETKIHLKTNNQQDNDRSLNKETFVRLTESCR